MQDWARLAEKKILKDRMSSSASLHTGEGGGDGTPSIEEHHQEVFFKVEKMAL